MGFLLSVVAFLPALVIAVLITEIEGPPVLYRARRVGLGGRPFEMLKFRTMVFGADRMVPSVWHLNVSDGMVKIPNDPRVTHLGRWLRRFSLDELPQLWNVLRGEMSLVGPRPFDESELAKWGGIGSLRLDVRPGITGIWQVEARNDPMLSTRVNLDRRYLENWSVRGDLMLIARTLPVVLRGRGGKVLIPAANDASGSE